MPLLAVPAFVSGLGASLPAMPAALTSGTVLGGGGLAAGGLGAFKTYHGFGDHCLFKKGNLLATDVLQCNAMATALGLDDKARQDFLPRCERVPENMRRFLGKVDDDCDEADDKLPKVTFLIPDSFKDAKAVVEAALPKFQVTAKVQNKKGHPYWSRVTVKTTDADTPLEFQRPGNPEQKDLGTTYEDLTNEEFKNGHTFPLKQKDVPAEDFSLKKLLSGARMLVAYTTSYGRTSDWMTMRNPEGIVLGADMRNPGFPKRCNPELVSKVREFYFGKKWEKTHLGAPHPWNNHHMTWLPYHKGQLPTPIVFEYNGNTPEQYFLAWQKDGNLDGELQIAKIAKDADGVKQFLATKEEVAEKISSVNREQFEFVAFKEFAKLLEYKEDDQPIVVRHGERGGGEEEKKGGMKCGWVILIIFLIGGAGAASLFFLKKFLDHRKLEQSEDGSETDTESDMSDDDEENMTVARKV